MAWRGLVVAAASMVAACGSPRHEPRLVWEGGGAPRVEDAAVAARALAPAGPGVRRGMWGDTSAATYQLIEADAPERPHVHAEHDLAVVILRGRGTLVVEDRRIDMASGDVLHVARGRVHHFHPRPGTSVLALAIYMPRLEKIDFVPFGGP